MLLAMTSRIRVLHCIETIASGGVEQVRLTLVRGLDANKYEHKIICTWAGGPVAAALEAEGVELIVIGSFTHPFEWRKHKKVLEVIRTYKPHIIHGAIFEGMTMAAIGGTLGRVPIIILEETSEPSTRSQKAILLQRVFVRLADKIIGISPTVVNYLKSKAKLPSEKVILINNGVSETSQSSVQISRNEYGIEEGDFLIGSVGRVYNEVKRFSDLLHAIKLIGNPKIKFLLLGVGPDLEMLKQNAIDLGIADQFIPVGYQSDPNPFYRIMNVFCLPSAHEGFGLVAVEAMLQKLPVIVSKVGGLQDIVIEGETGFLIPSMNPKAIASKIQVLLDNPDLRESMGNKGRLRALENYTAKRYCQEVEDLYLELLKKK